MAKEPKVKAVETVEETTVEQKRELLKQLLDKIEWTHIEKAAIYPLFESLFR